MAVAGMGPTLACGNDPGNSTGPRPVPALLEVVTGAVQAGTVGEALDTVLTVRVLDQFGAPLTGISVRFSVASGGGIVLPATVVTGADGRATGTWTLGGVPGLHTARAVVAGLDSVGFQATAATGPFARLEITGGDVQGHEPGEPLDSALVLRTTDRFGNPVGGVPVSFSVVPGTGTLGTTQAVSDVAGLVQTTLTLGQAPGVVFVEAASSGAGSIFFTATAFRPFVPDSIATGYGTSCHLPVSGGIRCWGDIVRDPDSLVQALPLPVTPDPGLVALTAGTFHACGLTMAGQAWCWGTVWGLSPVAVASSLAFRQIDAGGSDTCGLTADGAGWCWVAGWPTGTAPGRIAIGAPLRQVSVGLDHRCALTRSGEAWCWGSNQSGQLGDGSISDHSTPVRVQTTLRFQSIYAGVFMSCALTFDGVAYCWGGRNVGSDPPFSGDVLTPRQVGGGQVFRSIYPGKDYGCGITTGDALYCWGGSQVVGGRLFPAPFGNGAPTRTVSPSWSHACLETVAKEVQCWGLNSRGVVGVGYTGARAMPVAVNGEPELVSVTAGWWNTCGLDTTGAAWCWGVTGGPVPVPAGPGLTFSEIQLRGFQLCGRTTAGQLYCWEPTNYPPTLQAGGASFAAFTAGGNHICGLAGTGTASCLNSNDHGQLGDSTFTYRTSPVTVAGGHQFQRVAGAAQHTCGIDIAGALLCWGDAASLGTPAAADAPYPVPIPVAPPLSGLATSPLTDVTCAITGTGSGLCWGKNDQGQTGTGTTGVPVATPTAVAGGHTFAEIVIGQTTTCGLTPAGQAYCWGGGSAIGDGSFTARDTPSPVSGMHQFKGIAVGLSHACALEADGSAWCWGSNQYAELGTGLGETIGVPTTVP